MKVPGTGQSESYTRAETREAQQLLTQLDAFEGGADGVNGKATKEALCKFQKSMGLRVTGLPDGPTIALLRKTVGEEAHRDRLALMGDLSLPKFEIHGNRLQIGGFNVGIDKAGRPVADVIGHHRQVPLTAEECKQVSENLDKFRGGFTPDGKAKELAAKNFAALILKSASRIP